MAAITIAGVDIEATLGAEVHGLGETLHAALGQRAGVDVPTLPGVIRTGPYRTPVREFGFAFTLDGANQAAVRANLDQLKAICGTEESAEAEVVIVLGDQTDRQISARCVRLEPRRYPLGSTANSMNEVPVYVEAQFIADHPYWQSVTPSSVGFTTSPVAMPQGTAPSTPVLTTTAGAITTPTITCKDKDAATLWTCGLASLTSGQRYRLTTARGVMTIERWTGAAWESAEDARVSGVFPFPLPASGAGYLASDWPTLEATSGTWTADYPREWR